MDNTILDLGQFPRLPPRAPEQVPVKIVGEKWEYMELIGMPQKDRTQKLNELGAQGWEMVNFLVFFSNLHICLKRRVA